MAFLGGGGVGYLISPLLLSVSGSGSAYGDCALSGDNTRQGQPVISPLAL
jgi:hypothetical protein